MRLAWTIGFSLVAGTAYAGPTPGGVDSDGDTVADAFDNCTSIPNAAQTDTNHNGCGDACSPCDPSGDLVVGVPDLALVGPNMGMTVPPAPAGVDCNGDTIIGIPDMGAVGSNLGRTVGPSGITTAQCNPATCMCTPQ